jgi:hypothetical protein
MKKLYDILKEHQEIARLDDPKWESRRRYNEWRNHVPQDIMDNWKSLTSESRVVVYLMAQEAANRADWD